MSSRDGSYSVNGLWLQLCPQPDPSGSRVEPSITYHVQYVPGRKNLQTTVGSASSSLAYSGGISRRRSLVSSCFITITPFPLRKKAGRIYTFKHACLLPSTSIVLLSQQPLPCIRHADRSRPVAIAEATAVGRAG